MYSLKTREKLLILFEENKGIYFSGEEIAEKLSISRTAVWKAVNSLRKDGYEIDAVPNRGYCLAADTDILSVQGIRKYLGTVCSDLELHVLQTADSTNATLREKAAAGAREGCTVIANAQTGGRGRTGRSFFSPSDTGIYLSILLRPSRCSAREARKFTTIAAVAACEAIETLSENKAQIKWVNDIFIEGKKVGGILTEASVSLEDGFLDYVIVGIGINIYDPRDGFPAELQNIAGAVFRKNQNDGKNHLAAEFLNHFMSLCQTSDQTACEENYRKRSLVVGKNIVVHSSGQPRRALVLDIDREYRLLVRYEDGTTDRLSSGEVSISLE